MTIINLFKSSRIRFFVVVLYWITGFILTHMPVQDSGEPVFKNFDKVAHFCLYAGLCFLIAFWLGSKEYRTAACVKAFVICAIYGLLDEGIQYFIPSRNADLGDYLADVLGSGFGATVYFVLCKLLFTSKSTSVVK